MSDIRADVLSWLDEQAKAARVLLYHCCECGRELRHPECSRCGTYANTATNEIVTSHGRALAALRAEVEAHTPYEANGEFWCSQHYIGATGPLDGPMGACVAIERIHSSLGLK